MSSILLLDPTQSLTVERLRAVAGLGIRHHVVHTARTAADVLARDAVDVLVVLDTPTGTDVPALVNALKSAGAASEPSVIVVASDANRREVGAVADLVLPARVTDALFVRAVRLVLQGRGNAASRPAPPVAPAVVRKPSVPVPVPPPATAVEDTDKTLVIRRGARRDITVPEGTRPGGPVQPARTRAPAGPSGPARSNGTDVNGYRVIRALGKGGMSMVYLAHHEASGQDRVLKILPISEHDGGVLVQRLINEAALLSQISHPSVIRVHEHGFTDWHAYIAMEYLPGGDLRTVLGKPVPPSVAVEAIVQLGGALEAVHGAGMIHRDLKPENVLRRADGTFVLADFGIARQAGVQLSYVGTGHVMGTAAYLAPELMGSGVPDHRSDLYSLGVLFFEMLTGRKPYDGDDPVQVLNMHLRAPVPRLPATHAWAQGLIDRTMAKQPAQRFQSASALVTAVLSVVSTLQANASRAPPSPGTA